MIVKAKGQTPAEAFFLSKVEDGTLSVSKLGIIYNNKTKRYIGATGSGKYPKISMMDSDRTDIKHIQIHRLVWLVFEGDIPVTCELNHRDLNKENPKLTNLEVLTKAENAKHARKRIDFQARGEAMPHSVFTDKQVAKFRILYSLGLISVKQLRNKFNCSKNTVFSMLKGATYAHTGEGIKLLGRSGKSVRRQTIKDARSLTLESFIEKYAITPKLANKIVLKFKLGS